jgi:hypothetical protein
MVFDAAPPPSLSALLAASPLPARPAPPAPLAGAPDAQRPDLQHAAFTPLADDGGGLCGGRVRITAPAPGARLRVPRGGELDLEVAFEMGACALNAPRRAACAIVYVDDAPVQAHCPLPGEAASRVELYGIPPGAHAASIVPAFSGGEVFPDMADSAAFTVEEAAAEAAEAAEVPERAEACAPGSAAWGGVGRLERLLGLDAAAVDGIIASLRPGGGAAALAVVLDGAPLARTGNTVHPLQEVAARSPPRSRALRPAGVLPAGSHQSTFAPPPPPPPAPPPVLTGHVSSLLPY